MDHIQDQVCFLLKGVDLLDEVGDSDGVEGGHGHGCNGHSYGDEAFWSAWH
jgi:hypothetical protein